MNRFHQRLQEDLNDLEFAAGFHGMDAELQMLYTLEALCQLLQISQEELAKQVRLNQSVLSRLYFDLLDGNQENRTLNNIRALLGSLSKLGLTADITVRRSNAGEAPIHLSVLMSDQ